MCDFIIKLNEERRKIKRTSSEDSVNLDVSDLGVTESQQISNGIKDKSKLFSKFYENKSSSSPSDLKSVDESNSSVVRFFTGASAPKYKSNIQDTHSPVDEGVQEEIDSTEFIKNEDSNITMGFIAAPLKEYIQSIQDIKSKHSSEILESFYTDLKNIYERAITQEFTSVSTDEITKESEKSTVNENTVLINKMTVMSIRLSEKAHELQTIKNKLDNLYKNESFSYSTSKEIKEKIRLFGKKFYEVFKSIQKDLNSSVKNEYWSLIQFTKDTTDYRLLREKVKLLANSYNNYLSQVNTRLNDVISSESSK